jgi:hypothetical protein
LGAPVMTTISTQFNDNEPLHSHAVLIDELHYGGPTMLADDTIELHVEIKTAGASAYLVG